MRKRTKTPGPKNRTKERRALQRVIGIVDAESWSLDGRLTLVAIATDDDRFVVVPQGRGRALLDLVNLRVRATGTVDDLDGEPWIAVKSFETVDDIDILSDEPDWPDDDLDEWAGIRRDSFVHVGSRTRR